jgi:hypothetical protein
MLTLPAQQNFRFLAVRNHRQINMKFLSYHVEPQNFCTRQLVRMLPYVAERACRYRSIHVSEIDNPSVWLALNVVADSVTYAAPPEKAPDVLVSNEHRTQYLTSPYRRNPEICVFENLAVSREVSWPKHIYREKLAFYIDHSAKLASHTIVTNILQVRQTLI